MAKLSLMANRLVYIIGIVAAFITCGSGIAMVFAPGGEDSEETPGFLGVSRESLSESHESAVFAFIAIVVIHLVLHWRQIINMCKQCTRRPKRLASDPIILIVIIIAVLLTASIMPEIAETGDDEGSSILWGSIATYSHIIAGVAALAAVMIHSRKRMSRLRDSG